VCGARWEDDEPEENPMTQPEPTRDTRLLSAARLASIRTLAKLTDEAGNVMTAETVLLDHIAALEARIAAQDQRHAALVEAAKAVRRSFSAKCIEVICFVPQRIQCRLCGAQHYDPVYLEHKPVCVLGMLDAALAALAQPPGDE
jgi:hypothetical protein